MRLVTEPGYAPGLVPALQRLLRERGLLGGLFGEGLGPTLVKMTAYTTAQLTTFSLASEFFSGQLPLDAPRLLATLPAALLAGFVASIASQPGDTLQTCTSADGGGGPRTAQLIRAPLSL
ncbi:unnamed protein product [Polarella glacialis]|uniref:Uncharacterized protein n=1 Tax=Polarella glacialis TaxID=89957 RepID=A0A813E9Y0_POLGL|nr:unnamed protein product [Polarella glacialis]CAE8598523.1 unnamed protein product [Polarella glacialis]